MIAKAHELPLTVTHWGAYRAVVRDGKLTALHGFEEDTDPSPIADGMVDTLDDPCRIPQPMVRRGWLEHGAGSDRSKRGAEPFVAVSWDEASRLVARELRRVMDEHGNRAIFAGSYGWASAGRFHHAPSQLRRFLNCIGGHTYKRDTYSLAAGEVVLPHVVGDLFRLLPCHTSWPSIIEHTGLLVAFGGLPVKNGQIDAGGTGRHVQRDYMREAADAGVALVNVSPLRGDVQPGLGAEWIALRPNTDVALMLGLAHTLYTEGLHDEAFLANYTVGFERFVPYLTGARDGLAKDAGWAESITGIGAQTIRALARRMAAGRTMVSLAWSLTRQDHGEQPFWMGVTLASMLGQIGLPGGGVGFGYSAVNAIGNHTGHLPGAALPQGRNEVADFIPVARISDLLLNPGGGFDYNGKRYTYPDTRIVWWAGGNPFHHHQDLNRMLAAWRKPETIIVNEAWWNSMARHADIVLPCTSPLERDDIAGSPRDGYLFANRRVVEPYREARDDFAIFRGIARELGVESVYTEGRDVDEWLRHLYDVTRQRASERAVEMPSYDEFRARGVFKLADPGRPVVMLEAFRADPDASPLHTPSGRIEIFSERIDSFGYEDCRGHPRWYEPCEWLGGDGAARHPLHLISNQPATRLHGQLDNGRHSRAGKLDGREPLALHPADAGARGIGAGDPVRVFNDRGACLATAVVSEDVRPGVVRLPTGAWYDPEIRGEPGVLCKHGNPNVLTPDKGTSRLAQGPIAHTCLVEVERFEGVPPAVTAFEPPEIIQRGSASDRRGMSETAGRVSR